MKTYLLILAFFTGTTFLVSSCNEDDTSNSCDNVGCLNGGVCNNGTCICTSGYEGDNCQTMVNEKFAGTYNGNETKVAFGNTTGPFPITVVITAKNTSPFDIAIKYDGIDLEATTNGNAITIPSQDGSDNYQWSGTGSLSGNTLIINALYSGSAIDRNFTGNK